MHKISSGQDNLSGRNEMLLEIIIIKSLINLFAIKYLVLRMTRVTRKRKETFLIIIIYFF